MLAGYMTVNIEITSMCMEAVFIIIAQLTVWNVASVVGGVGNGIAAGGGSKAESGVVSFKNSNRHSSYNHTCSRCSLSKWHRWGSWNLIITGRMVTR